MMQRILTLLTLPVALFIVGLNASSAHASSFNAGKIIDDIVFTNSSSMSVDQIQSFLNSKVPTCDTNGTMPASDFGRSDLTHAQYAASRGWPGPPYTCLKNYSENGISSAQLIYNLSQQYQINPQVFIVTLQKEASLVTDYWPLSSQYRTATGYGCPDSGPNNSANCSATYYGFTNQMTWTAKMYRAVLNQSPTWYSPYVVGNNYIQWSPTASCGGSTVNIQNWSTAALYDYTPYQPNAAALNAGYGMGDSCSAYGNRNFWLYFTDWFGDTQIQVLASFAQRYSELGGKSGILGNVTMNQVCGLRSNGCYQGFQNGGIYWSAASGTFESTGPVRTRYMELGTENSTLGYPASALICGLKDSGCYQGYQNGSIYYSPKVGRAYENAGSFRDRYLELGTETGLLGYPASATICGLRSGGCYQGYENGAIYKSAFGTYENYGVIRDYYITTGTENGLLGYPSGSPHCDTKNNGCYQIFERGSVYQTAVTGTHSVIGGVYAKWSSAGKEWGALGFPITDEIYGAKDGGSYQQFEGGYIYWTPKGGRIVLNSIAQRWQELGKEWGKLGYPVTDSVCGIKNDGCYQVFENGNTVYWSQPTGSKTVWGAIYTAWNNTGKEWGKLGLPTTNETYDGGTARQDFEGGVITWTSTNGASISYR